MENINENVEVVETEVQESECDVREIDVLGFETSEKVDEIFPALVNFHKSIESIKMTSVNPFFSSKYADLQDILSNVNPLLAENDMFIMQIPTNKGDDMMVHTRIIHKSGQYVMANTVSLRKAKDAQQTIAFSTYMRRTSITSLLSLCLDKDDDGNSLQQSTPSTPTSSESVPSRRRR